MAVTSLLRTQTYRWPTRTASRWFPAAGAQ